MTIIPILILAVVILIVYLARPKDYVSKKQMNEIMKQLNKRVTFFDSIDDVSVYTIDYDKNNLTNYHYDILSGYIEKNEKNFNLLMNHLNLKIESGDRITKIK